MRKCLLLAQWSIVLAAASAAQAQGNRPDLSALPDVLKGLKWKDIDTAKLSALERCRALLFLNASLDELSSGARAEADLLSAFIDKQKLGPEFLNSPPPVNAAPLNCGDGLKVAVAMLRGPLAQSSYATDFAGVSDPKLLECNNNMYEPICQRKWSEMAESRQQVRWMASFLQAKKKMDEYQAWAPLEVQRREQEYQQEMARRRAAVLANTEAQEQRSQDIEQQNIKQQQQQQAAMQQMQMAMCVAQQQAQNQANEQVVATVGNNDWYPGWYNGAISNLGGVGWYRDGAYRGVAGANVEGRYAGWHGAAVGRR